MSSKINFIELTNQELSSKIALLVLNKARIIFWKNSPRYFEGEVVSNDDKLIVRTRELHLKLVNEQICLNFSLNQMEYFIKGKVTSHNDENETLEVELYDQCFRVEKRDYERVQVYPYYDAYVYLKYNEAKNDENIFFINKNDQKKNDLFSNIRSLEKQKLASRSQELLTNDDEELIGFRVEDLSSNGLCFLVSQREKEQVLSRFLEFPFKLLLSFGPQNFPLESVKIIYQINYINQQFAGVPMFKIGVTFKENGDLKAKVKELLGHDGKLLDYQKEFEEFIKNE